MNIHSIQVFCGARMGNQEAFIQATQALGSILAQKNIKIVYGGGQVGLMGVLADAALWNGGYVTGVIPTFLMEKELGHKAIQEMIVVETMHERKIRMAGLSDATIALPGGFGTMDEVFEVLTMVQLGKITQPVGILNVEGFYDPLLVQMRRMHDAALLNNAHLQMLIVSRDPRELVEKILEAPTLPLTGKWD
jgi:uncharacterized protein (TIGR00730 family)